MSELLKAIERNAPEIQQIILTYLRQYRLNLILSMHVLQTRKLTILLLTAIRCSAVNRIITGLLQFN